jgi:hypothetical protein
MPQNNAMHWSNQSSSLKICSQWLEMLHVPVTLKSLSAVAQWGMGYTTGFTIVFK